MATRRRHSSFTVAVVSTTVVVWTCATAVRATTLNVEIDYMVASDHSHRPNDSEINAIVEMFACHGYTLNVVIDDAITEVPTLRCDDLTDGFWSCRDSRSFRTIKDAHFDHGAGWHYCVFGHDYNIGSGTGSSGLAEILGDDFTVTMGSFSGQIGTAFDRAATFAHEFGHNLGLEHTSPESSFPSGNYAPNYASIMSYQFQLSGVKSELLCLGLIDSTALYKDIDYSNGRLPAIPEVLLLEAYGVGIRRVDWDCDGTVDTSPVNVELDGFRPPWCSYGVGGGSWLSDHDDWSNITDVAARPDFNPEAPTRTVSCITAEEARRREAPPGLLPDPSLCPSSQPALQTESCEDGLMIWVNSGYTGTESGTGDEPYKTFSGAYSAAPDGSTLYLQQGTYTNSGTTLRLTKRLTIAGPGVAVVNP